MANTTSEEASSPRATMNNTAAPQNMLETQIYACECKNDEDRGDDAAADGKQYRIVHEFCTPLQARDVGLEKASIMTFIGNQTCRLRTLSRMLVIRVNRTVTKPATAARRNDGATACEMTCERWSTEPTSTAIEESYPCLGWCGTPASPDCRNSRSIVHDGVRERPVMADFVVEVGEQRARRRCSGFLATSFTTRPIESSGFEAVALTPATVTQHTRRPPAVVGLPVWRAGVGSVNPQ